VLLVYCNLTMCRDKSFADDLIVHRGVVSSRVALLLRSAETKPLMPRFVPFRNTTYQSNRRPLSVRLSGGTLCLAVWLSGCLAVWLSGCLAVWLSGCLAVWLSGCLAVWAVWLSGCLGCLAVWLSGCLDVYYLSRLLVPVLVGHQHTSRTRNC
jgi:hypothetical protein